MIGLEMIIDFVNSNAVGIACADEYRLLRREHATDGSRFSGENSSSKLSRLTFLQHPAGTNRLGVDTALANVTNIILNLEILSFARSRIARIGSKGLRRDECAVACVAAIRYWVFSKVHLRNAKVHET